MTKSPSDLQRGLPPSVTLDGDGSAVTFCSTCAFSGACLASGYGKRELAQLHCLVEHIGPLAAGEHVFRTGESFRAIFAVRAGSVKTVMNRRDGHEQVLGFYLPGELVGLNAIYPEHYPCDAVTLEPSHFCRFSFPAMSALATRMPTVQQHLFGLLSRELGMASMLAGDHPAEERLAAFLLDLGGRYQACGYSGTQFRLSMSRADIANYLRLATETVSRVLRRFRERELLRIQGRQIEILAPAQLQAMVGVATEN